MYRKLVLVLFATLTSISLLLSHDCSISDVTFEFVECDETGAVFIIYDFEHSGTSDTYVVGADGGGSVYHYTDLPFTLGPFSGDGSTLVLEFIDSELENCFNFLETTLPTCNADCEIFNPNFQFSQCDVMNVDVLIDFDYNGTSEQFILGGAGGGQTINYADLPFSVGPFQGNGSNITFEIVDVENQTCFEVVIVTLPDCAPDCNIFDVTHEISECDEEGNVFVVLNFLYEDVGDFFILGGDGNGQEYSYVDLPIVLEDIPADGSAYALEIIDGTTSDCFEELTFKLPDCTDVCQITNFFAESYEDCNDDGSFNVDVEFDVINGNGSGFNLYANGIFHSFFVSYPTEYITIVIDSMAANSTVELTVIDQGNENCSANFSVLSPDCMTSSNEYLNPAFSIDYFNSTLLISSNLESFNNAQIFISNTFGTQIFGQTLTSNTFQTDIASFPAGIYFVTLAFENNFFTKKISVH